MDGGIPLPFCPECGWTAPSHELPRSDRFRRLGEVGATYMAGPFSWRSYPEFRCGCRIVWEAREKGLIDEACGGKGWAGRPLSRSARLALMMVDANHRLEIAGHAAEGLYESCGGHGPGVWSIERLVGEKVRQAVAELKKVVLDGIWDWDPARLQSARAERADLDAKIEASRKRWEGTRW